MNADFQTNPCFSLLQKMLSEAFQVDAHYFSPPYEDLSRIDKGIRSLVWPDFTDRRSAIKPIFHSEAGRFLVSKSNLGFYNIIIFFNDAQDPDFISIGPFRAAESSLEYLRSIQENAANQHATRALLQEFLEGLPCAPLNPVVNIAKSVIAAFFPEFQDAEPVYLEFSGHTHKIQIDQDILTGYTMEYAELYRDYLLKFLEYVKKGDSDSAQASLKELMRETGLSFLQNIPRGILELHRINNYCQLALLETEVHPVHVLKLATAMQQKIDKQNNREAILGLVGELCHKYCLLAKNFAYPEYSRSIRDVINYIRLHLEENLNLALLAEHFHKNASALSAAFSREVGMPLTDYIHQERINEALRYFNSTKLSVSEVALSVGFQDFAYFSRLFKRQVGCSPREYCKRIR